MRNPVELLADALQQQLPALDFQLDRPDRPTGRWFLDLKLHSNSVTVEWRKGHGLGIVSGNAEYGEGPDEVYRDRKAAEKRILELLNSGSPSLPPGPVMVSRIREAVGMTQQQVADRMHIKQSSVSKLESANDMQIGTLRRYVASLGGKLRIEVDLPGRSISLTPE